MLVAHAPRQVPHEHLGEFGSTRDPYDGLPRARFVRNGLARYPAGPGTDTTGGGGGGGGGGSTLRCDITVRVTIAPEDASIFETLGWSSSTLPPFQVLLRRDGSSVVDTALTDATGTVGFGLYTGGHMDVLGIGRRVDFAQLERKLDPSTNSTYVFLPASHILDVHATIDRSVNYARFAGDTRSLQRPVAYKTGNGKAVLLRTKSSAVDFVPAPPSPFRRWKTFPTVLAGPFTPGGERIITAVSMGLLFGR